MLDPDDALELAEKEMLPALLHERSERLDRIDEWMRVDHDGPSVPSSVPDEYQDLRDRSQEPWLGLVVSSVVQSMYVDGYRSSSDEDNDRAWAWWQANQMDRRQVAIHRAAVGYGLAYATVLPGENYLGDAMPVIRGVSPRNMIAFYLDPAGDEWPQFALQADPAQVKNERGVWVAGWTLKLYDDECVHHMLASDGGRIEYVTFDEHGVRVCPVVRFTNQLDLEGRADGEVEPFIPIAARIEQDALDRLVIQRFQAHQVRWATGLDESANESPEATKARLAAESVLASTGTETKFGTLAATDLTPILKAHEEDVRTLAALSQTPAHEMLGALANLSAEALAAARASLKAKVEERRISLGESHEQVLRLADWINDPAGGRNFDAQVRWRDTDIRSLSQAADALGKVADQLGVPVEMLWEKLPNWTQLDQQTAKKLVAEGDSLSRLTEEINRGRQSATGDPDDDEFAPVA